jgi:TRAP-type C4-dicarboxylate transport system permease small subunit
MIRYRLDKVGRLFDRLLGFMVYVASAMLAFILLAVCWDVVARTLVGSPLPWVLEFTEYSLLYVTFLCTTWVLKNEGHVNTDLLLIALRKDRRAFLNGITSIVGAGVSIVLTYFGLLVSLGKLRDGSFQPTAMAPPDFPLFIIIPFGFFLLTFQFIRRACRHFSEWKALRTTAG